MFRQMTATLVLLAMMSTTPVRAQEGAAQRPPEFLSTEVSPERVVTFRVFAPKATSVRLSSSDMPSMNRSASEMKKADNGVWEVTSAAVPAGAYRYKFSVDDLAVVDPRNPATSESNNTTWSLVTVPGSESSDVKDVPHGAVAHITYYSKSLGRSRRMHVYTPPGYEAGSDRLPVFYLLHGSGDSDQSWSTIGQAGRILDNLIASGKAKPMIVVMPAGHTGSSSFGAGNRDENQRDKFTEDFQQDLRPLIEKRYRVSNERRHRAIAGLSMGGAQTLTIGMTDLGDFGYLGVFSSGIFGRRRRGGNESDRPDPVVAWESKFEKSLNDPELAKGLRLVWFATGKDDFLLSSSRSTVELFKKHGFNVEFKETEGGHTWLNWREYLNEFAPRLFNDDGQT